MANQYSADVPKGFNVPKQVRLDSITGIQNEENLKDLGPGNNLAFKYYEGLKIYCKDEKTEYIWREVIGSETGLLDTPFVYPTYSPVDEIDYSGKSFNFFEVTNSNAQPPDGSETKLIEGSNITITGTGTILDPYEISSNSEISETYIEEGDNITITGSGIISDPYIVNADLTDLGIVKTIGNEIISPGQSLSIINNESTGKALVTKEYVQSIIPNIPDGSETKLNPGNNITITGSGTILNPYIINSSGSGESVYINSGDNISITGTGTIIDPYIINIVQESSQKILTSPADFISSNYTLTSVDNDKLFFIYNGATNVTITVPTGLPNEFFAAFIQKGTGDVTFVESGTTVETPLGLKIKGIKYQVALDKVGVTNVFNLTGNTKV